MLAALETPPGARTDADVLREHAREMALVSETGFDRNSTERTIGGRDQALGAFDALQQRPLMRRMAECLPKRRAEVTPRQSAGARQFRQPQTSRQTQHNQSRTRRSCQGTRPPRLRVPGNARHDRMKPACVAITVRSTIGQRACLSIEAIELRRLPELPADTYQRLSRSDRWCRKTDCSH